jgi:hypothetical protein
MLRHPLIADRAESVWRRRSTEEQHDTDSQDDRADADPQRNSEVHPPIIGNDRRGAQVTLV